MTDEQIIAYFLGELPEEESERFEEELFAAEELPPEVRAVEDDLIDDYLRDKLPRERRKRFEENYLWSEARREKVVAAGAILRHIDESVPEPIPEPVNPWWSFWSGWAMPLRLAAVAAVVVVFVGVIWLVAFRTNTPRTFAIVELPLSASTRGGGDPIPKRITLPIDHDALELRLELPKDAPAGVRYEAQMQDRDEVQYSLGPVRLEGQRAIVTIDVSKIRRGSYELTLEAVGNAGPERIGKYRLNVE